MKIDQKNFKEGHLFNFLTFQYFVFTKDSKNPSVIKMELENLTKIPTDPFSDFLAIIKKLITVIHSKNPIFKNDFRKYCVDLFYNNLFLSKTVSTNTLKSELHKVKIKKFYLVL